MPNYASSNNYPKLCMLLKCQCYNSRPWARKCRLKLLLLSLTISSCFLLHIVWQFDYVACYNSLSLAKHCTGFVPSVFFFLDSYLTLCISWIGILEKGGGFTGSVQHWFSPAFRRLYGSCWHVARLPSAPMNGVSEMKRLGQASLIFLGAAEFQRLLGYLIREKLPSRHDRQISWWISIYTSGWQLLDRIEIEQRYFTLYRTHSVLRSVLK